MGGGSCFWGPVHGSQSPNSRNKKKNSRDMYQRTGLLNFGRLGAPDFWKLTGDLAVLGCLVQMRSAPIIPVSCGFCQFGF